MDFPTGLEGAKEDRQAAFLKGREGVAEAFPPGVFGVGDDQDHGELPAEDGTARVGDVAAESKQDFGDLGDDAGAIPADDGQGEMVHVRLSS